MKKCKCGNPILVEHRDECINCFVIRRSKEMVKEAKLKKEEKKQ